MTIKIDFTKIKPQYTADQLWKIVATPATPVGKFILPLETLTPARTVGRGKNTFVNLKSDPKTQLDFEVGASPYPYARFEAGGWVSMHFDPSEYGITSVQSYIMEFNIQCGQGGQTTSFTFAAMPGITTKWDPYTVDSVGGTGQLIMNNVPSGPVWGQLLYSSGAPWVWYSTGMQRPSQ
jgi:hypothetical protein